MFTFLFCKVWRISFNTSTSSESTVAPKSNLIKLDSAHEWSGVWIGPDSGELENIGYETSVEHDNEMKLRRKRNVWQHISSENENITLKTSNPVQLCKNAIRAFLLQNDQIIYCAIYVVIFISLFSTDQSLYNNIIVLHGITLVANFSHKSVGHFHSASPTKPAKGE